MKVNFHTIASLPGCFLLMQALIHLGHGSSTETVGYGHAVDKRQVTGPTLSLEIEAVSEGVGTIEVCAQGGSTPASVTLRTTDNCRTSSTDACDGSDYTGINETFTLNPGDETCFDIIIVDDSDLEFTEGFRVELTIGGILADSATVYIKENDEAPSLQVLLHQFIVDEGVGIVKVCVLGGSVSIPVLLNTTDSCGSQLSACGGSDYVAISEAFTINPGETRCFSLTILDDVNPENITPEFFGIELVNAGSPVVCSHLIPLFIQDNEEAPKLDIRTPSNIVNESNGFVEICVLGGSVENGVSLMTRNCPGCEHATANVDYSRVLAQFLIQPGETVCFNSTIVNDNIPELTESFGVQLSDINGALELLAVHIRDDDKVPSFDIGQFIVDERDDFLEKCVVGADVSMGVILTTIGDCSSPTGACDGEDFNGINEAFTINPGEKVCFNITLMDDQLVEFTEEIVVLLRNQPGQLVFSEISVIYIRDNEEAPRLAGGLYAQVDEDIGTVPVCVLGGNVAVPAILTTGSECNGPTFASGDTDFIIVNETITVNPGEMQCFNLTVMDDVVAENKESICIELESADSTHTFSSTLQLDIKDDDAPSLELQLSTLQTEEDVGVIGVCVVGGSATVLASLGTPGIYDDVTVGDDFTGIAETFTIGLGERKCFNVSIVDDSDVEPAENLNIFLGTASGFVDSVYNIISDNDSPFLNRMIYKLVEGSEECSVEDEEQSEGSEGTDTESETEETESDTSESETEETESESCGEQMCISRRNGLGAPVSTIFTTADDITTEPADYIGVIHSFCIDYGQEKCFGVSITDDVFPERKEDVELRLISSVKDEIGLLRIKDNDACPPKCTFDFCWRERSNRRKATCTLPAAEVPDSSVRCHVTSCRACYFSEEERDFPENCQYSCLDAADTDGCLRRWGRHVYKKNLLVYGQAPPNSRTEELFKCHSHPWSLAE